MKHHLQLQEGDKQRMKERKKGSGTQYRRGSIQP